LYVLFVKSTYPRRYQTCGDDGQLGISGGNGRILYGKQTSSLAKFFGGYFGIGTKNQAYRSLFNKFLMIGRFA